MAAIALGLSTLTSILVGTALTYMWWSLRATQPKLDQAIQAMTALLVYCDGVLSEAEDVWSSRYLYTEDPASKDLAIKVQGALIRTRQDIQTAIEEIEHGRQ